MGRAKSPRDRKAMVSSQWNRGASDSCLRVEGGGQEMKLENHLGPTAMAFPSYSV